MFLYAGVGEMGPEIDSLEYDRQGSSVCKENVVCGGEE